MEVNKLNEWLNERETFVDTVGIKRTELDDKLLFLVFTAFRVALMYGKAAYCHVMSGVVGQIKVSRLQA